MAVRDADITHGHSTGLRSLRRLKEELGQLNATTSLLESDLQKEEEANVNQSGELEAIKDLMRQAIVSQQESEERCTRSERLTRDIQVSFEQQKQEWIKMNTALREHVDRLLHVYGNFDIVWAIFTQGSQLHPTPHAPCDVLYLVPMLVGC